VTICFIKIKKNHIVLILIMLTIGHLNLR